MINWFFQTLRTYPEIAIFLSLALGYYFGSFTYKGLGLGAVTATLRVCYTHWLRFRYDAR